MILWICSERALVKKGWDARLPRRVAAFLAPFKHWTMGWASERIGMLAKGGVDEIISTILDEGIEPRILAVGVGGAGVNIVTSIFERDVQGIETVAINTDSAALARALADRKISIGEPLLGGKGALGYPELGRCAADLHRSELKLGLVADIVFIVVGMGGGTGTGASPVVAEIARENGAVTIAIAIMPFKAEKRCSLAQTGIERLKESTDALIVLDNNSLSRFSEQLGFHEALEVVNQMVVKIIESMSMRITESLVTTLQDEVENLPREMEIKDGFSLPLEVLSPAVAHEDLKPLSFDSGGFIGREITGSP